MERTLLIAFHSQSGNTKRLAEAVADGARRVTGVQVSLKQAGTVTDEDMCSCRCMVVCTPEYFGYMAGGVKDMFDRTYETCRHETIGKSCVLIVSAGNDGTGALTSMQRILAGYGVRYVQEPVVWKGTVTEEATERCRELGETLAAGLELGIY